MVRLFICSLTLAASLPIGVHAQPAAGVPSHDVCSNGQLPLNVMARQGTTSTMRAMLEKSPFFVRQCERLAASPHVRVVVRVNGRFPTETSFAQTVFLYGRAGGIIAKIDVGVMRDVELAIAHEFEHVLEQIDGWDLKRLVRTSGSGVHRLWNGTYQTARAVDAGLEVQREVRAFEGASASDLEARLTPGDD